MSKPGRGLKDAFVELSFEQAEKHDELVQKAVELAEDNNILEGAAREFTRENIELEEELAPVIEGQRKRIATRERNKEEKHQKLRDAAAARWQKKPSHSTNAVAEYLIDEEITTLKIRQVTEIIKHLKPPQ